MAGKSFWSVVWFDHLFGEKASWNEPREEIESMGKNCGNCSNACGTAEMKVNKVFTGYVLKDVCSGHYLDVDENATGGEPPYYLHGDRKDALRFSTRDEAYRELAEVLLAGVDMGSPLPYGSFLRLKPVKLVKKIR